MKKYFMSTAFTIGFFWVYGQQEADSTLTSEEIQFRDSITAINTNNALIQEIQVLYNYGTEAFASSNFKNAITEPENVTAPTAAPMDISIKLANFILSGNPRPKASGFRKAAMATKTAANPTKL